MQQRFTAAAIVTTQFLDWFNAVKPALEFRRTLHYTQLMPKNANTSCLYA